MNSKYIRMDPEKSQSDTVLSFVCAMGYKIERTPPRDKHAEGIAERMVGVVTAKTNTARVRSSSVLLVLDHVQGHSRLELQL